MNPLEPLRTTPFVRIALLSVLVLIALACRREPKTTPEASGDSSDDTVIVTLSWDMQGVNQVSSQANAMHTAIHGFGLFLHLFEEVPNMSEGPSEFRPQLATSYEISPDTLTIIVKLRDDVLWSDGTPTTAEDVRWTWEAQTSPEILWDSAYTKQNIADIEVIDPQTLRFHLSQPQAAELQLMTINSGVVLPKHAWGELPFAQWRERPEWFVDNLVVNGPFTLQSWEPGQRIVLGKNTRYYEAGLPRIERLVFEITPDPNSQLARMRSGEAQFMLGLSAAQGDIVKQNERLNLVVTPARQIVYISWNHERPFFSSPALRRAVTMGIDRVGLVASLYQGYANVSNSPYLSNWWISDNDLEPWPYDPERAARILAEEGWADHDGDGVIDRDGVPFRFELLSPAGNQIRADAQVIIQEQLGRLGIEVIPRALDLPILSRLQNEHNYDASITGVGLDTSLDLSFLFQTGAPWNWSSYSNPRIDALLQDLEQQPDQRTALPLYRELQAVLHQDQPYTFLYEPQQLLAMDRRLKGFEPSIVSAFASVRYWHLADD